jgi:hypothetical protein
MRSIARGLYFRERNGERYVGEWDFLSPSLLSNSPQQPPDDLGKVWDQIHAVRFAPVATPEPTVFKFGRFSAAASHISYKFEFYGGFLVYAWDCESKYFS